MQTTYVGAAALSLLPTGGIPRGDLRCTSRQSFESSLGRLFVSLPTAPSQGRFDPEGTLVIFQTVVFTEDRTIGDEVIDSSIPSMPMLVLVVGGQA